MYVHTIVDFEIVLELLVEKLVLIHLRSTDHSQRSTRYCGSSARSGKRGKDGKTRF